jgi:hypothetical protein
MHAADDRMAALIGNTGIEGEDVVLAIADKSHHGSVGQ